MSAAIAPFLGGWLLEAGSWRPIFLINVPVAAAVAWITRRHVPESRDTSLSGSADWPGALAGVTALATITYAIIVLPGGGADPVQFRSSFAQISWICAAAFACAAVLAATFITGPGRPTPARRPALIQTPVPHLACPVAFHPPHRGQKPQTEQQPDE